MGFPVAWQSKITHDSVIAKQEFHIRLLETIRKAMLQRVKCSKDYANALSNSVAQTGVRNDKTEDFSGKKKKLHYFSTSHINRWCVSVFLRSNELTKKRPTENLQKNLLTSELEMRFNRRII